MGEGEVKYRVNICMGVNLAQIYQVEGHDHINCFTVPVVVVGLGWIKIWQTL